MSNFKFIIVILYLILLCFIFPINSFSDIPDYYTGLGQEFEVKYYSYLLLDKTSGKYAFYDELNTIDLEFSTFYKVISNKTTKKKIIGAFYLIGKLKWAFTYDNNENIIRIEKYDNNGEIISDKHYTNKGGLFYESEVGKFPIYSPRHKRKPLEDIKYVYAYITKEKGVEIIDRREITKFYPTTIVIDCIRDRYYNPLTGKIIKECLYQNSSQHLYDLQFFYNGNILEYTEYTSKNELKEIAFYIYNKGIISEVEYRGIDDKNIVREIYEEGKIKTIISYYIYYLPEVIINFDKDEKPFSATHNRYDSTFRLIKTHNYTMKDGKFDKEEVKDAFGYVYEDVNYEYSKNNLVKMIRKGVRDGNNYKVEVNYTYDNKDNLKSASSGGTFGGSMTYNYDNERNLIEIINSASEYRMIFYTNFDGELNIDVFNSANSSGMIYDREEKVIATKQYNSDSIITVSNKGVVIKYEKINKDETTIIHFKNSKPYMYELISTENRSPLYREYYDESGNKYKTVSYDPDNYKENFIEYDDKGKKISEYQIDGEGSLIAKLFYDDKERPHIYEEYSSFGVVSLFSTRLYDDKTNKLINYSVYKNFDENGFKLSSFQLYGEGEFPEVVFVFDDLTHLITSVQFNNKDGNKTKFIWHKITILSIIAEIFDYIRNIESKFSYAFYNSNEPKSYVIKEQPFYNNIK